MKKLLVLLSLVVLSGCMADDIFEPVNTIVPESLEIMDIQGLKLESVIVSEEVQMNVKLSKSGEYRIKIRDIGKNLVSQEKITGELGDNILKVYVSSLPKDSYTIELVDGNNDILGISTFVVN
jgi:hypothetical protein